MTTVTLATLSDSGSIFIRDCIRENITDPQNPERNGDDWIFDSQPKKRTINYPFVIIETADEDDENITINGETTINNDIVFHIVVWASKRYDKNVLADEIVTVLKNVNSTDHNDESLADKNLIFQRAHKSDHDAYKTDTELVYIKFVEVTFQYIGA